MRRPARAFRAASSAPRLRADAVRAPHGSSRPRVVGEVDAKELLPDTELIAVRDRDFAADLDERAVGRAEVDERESRLSTRLAGTGGPRLREPVRADDGVPAAQKRILREDNVTRLATQNRFPLGDVVDV